VPASKPNSTLLTISSLVGLLLLTALLYRPGLVDLWLFDDHPVLGPLVDDLGSGTTLEVLISEHGVSRSGPTGRPLSMLSFVVDGWSRGPDLSGWKQTNLALHLLNGLLVFFLIRGSSTAFGRGLDRNDGLALAVTALWIVHPLLVSTVLYTVQRMTLLATLFQLLGLVSYLHARACFIQRRVTASWSFMVLALLCFPLGLLSKETGVLLLVFIALFELLMLTGGHADNMRIRGWSRAVLGATVAAGGLIVAGWLLLSGPLDSGFATRPFTIEERLLTQARVVIEYAVLTLLPSLAGMKFIHDDIGISSGWLDPVETLVSVLVLVALAWSAWRMRRRVPLYSFGIGMFLCGHLLESTFLALDLMYEHRQYLPSIGLLLAVIALVVRLPMPRAGAVGMAVLLLALFSWMTWQRTVVWSSEDRFFVEMVRINSDSPRAMSMAANRFAERGRMDLARQVLAKIDSPGGRLNALYYDCIESGALAEGTLLRLPAPRIVTAYEASGLMYLGRAGLAGQCGFPEQEYLELLARWMERPVHASRGGLLIYRGYYLERAGKLDEAVETLRASYRVSGGAPVALVIAAELLVDGGELARAQQLLNEARGADELTRSDYSRDIEAAEARLVMARERPGELKKFDPFQE